VTARHPGRRLIFVGEAIVDLVMWVPALPPPGGDMLATSAETTIGGGYNVMVAAARQGLEVIYAGGHGTGPWGDLARSALAEAGIAASAPPRAGEDTGFDVVLVDGTGERTFVTRLGAESRMDAAHLATAPVRPGDTVYVSGYGLVVPGQGSVLATWLAALAETVTVVIDPGPLVGDIPDEVLGPVLARCDWWTCNLREAGILTGAAADDPAPDPLVAARTLAERTGRRGGVLVRSGPGGTALALDGQPALALPATSVAAVDSTGAGDAHTGVFMAALAAGFDPRAAVARANIAAAIAVTRLGPATAPTAAEIDDFASAHDLTEGHADLPG
jgi:sugar/nucleoside kinase (ribokinase family)